MQRLRMPLLAGALLASVAAAGIAPALAQTAPAAPAAQSAMRHHAPRLMPGQLVEGKIAFLKTELKITPQQEAQWNGVATALRDNAKAMDQAIVAARQDRGKTDAVTRIALRSDFAKVHADNDARFLAAFRPLYGTLSPQQQEAANQLLAHHSWKEHHRA